MRNPGKKTEEKRLLGNIPGTQSGKFSKCLSPQLIGPRPTTLLEAHIEKHWSSGPQAGQVSSGEPAWSCWKMSGMVAGASEELNSCSNGHNCCVLHIDTI